MWREDQKWPHLLMHHWQLTQGRPGDPGPCRGGTALPVVTAAVPAAPVRAPRPTGLHIPAPQPPWCGDQAWRLVTITCPEQNLKTTSLPSACSLKVNIFSLTLCRDLRCSSSVPLSLMAWIHAEHARTWHRAGAHLGAGEETAAGGAVP